MPTLPEKHIRGATRPVAGTLLFWWLVAVALLCVQRPITTPDLWWTLARGRAVSAGSTAPSQQLLLLDHAAEADWLGGVPFYLLWSAGGGTALSLVSATATLILLCSAIRPMTRRGDALLLIVIVPLSFILLRQGLQPGPLLWDGTGLLLVWRLSRAALKPIPKGLAVLALFCVWANAAPLPVWGLICLLLSVGRVSDKHGAESLGQGAHRNPETVASSGRLSDWWLPAAAVAGGMLSPRGIFAWRDSIVLFAANAFGGSDPRAESAEVLQLNYGGQQPAFSDPRLVLLWCLCGVCCFGGMIWLRTHSVGPKSCCSRALFVLRQVSRFGIPALAGLLNSDNLPLCGLWVLLQLSDEHGSRPAIVRSRIGSLSAGCLMSVFIAVDAAGHGLAPYSRLGWGIAHELDLRLLNLPSWSGSSETVIIWTPDRRSAGLAAWQGPGSQLLDHPGRALLGGRLSDHVSLMADLRGAHRAQYRRADGAWGGWHPRLSEWDVDLMLIPAEMVALNRAVQRSTWKAMDLDSPTIPFGSTDDTRFSAAILEALQQQAFVEAGPWQPTADMYDGTGWRWDVAEVIGCGPDPVPAIRQSQLFRAMDLPVASLRALLPIRERVRHRALTAEFRNCQRDLCYQEWSDFGQASYFRRAILKTMSTAAFDTDKRPWLTISPEEESQSAKAWESCTARYLTAALTDAIRELDSSSSEQIFAAAMMWMELGDSSRARAAMDEIIARDEQQSLVLAAKYWQQQMEAFEGP